MRTRSLKKSQWKFWTEWVSKALSGKRVNVNVNGHLLATPRVNSLGHFTVNRNTNLGQAVPNIKAGSTVRVRTLGGTLVASGTF